MRKIKVLIIDDSPLVRVFLKKVLSEDENIKVVGTAANSYQAVEEIKLKDPDLLTLDVEMPGMNGLEFLSKLMSAHPMPVIMVSTLTRQGSDITLKALEMGAVDFIAKPDLRTKSKLPEFKREVITKVKAVNDIRMKKIINLTKGRKNYLVKKPVEHCRDSIQQRVIGIGVSTGGVQTLKKLLPTFPSDLPGIILVQHMPQGFTSSFADLLNKISRIKVKEAQAGDKIIRGQALLVPGDFHLTIEKRKEDYYVNLNKNPKVNHQRPSVDITFNSLAEVLGNLAIGVLLTGMGKDGARGMKNIKNAGGYTIAQDKETAIVYGMPKAAVDMDAVDEILPLDEISQRITKITSEVN